MAWGSAPHEGYEARLLRDGRMVGEWSAETNRESTGTLAVLCSCGWRGDGVYRDWGSRPDGSPWWPGLDSEDQAMHDEWWRKHMAPLVDPHTDSILVLGQDAGSLRHFLAGEPVHAGHVPRAAAAGRPLDPRPLRVELGSRRPAARPPGAGRARGGPRLRAGGGVPAAGGRRAALAGRAVGEAAVTQAIHVVAFLLFDREAGRARPSTLTRLGVVALAVVSHFWLSGSWLEQAGFPAAAHSSTAAVPSCSEGVSRR